MRKILSLLSASACLVLTASSTPNAMVVPGRSLGTVALGAPATTLATLGPAAAGDAAMQKSWGTWYGRRPNDGTAPTQLDVYSALAGNDPDQPTVQVVRATSPWFHLANGLRVGARFSAIRAVYGPLSLAATYQLAAGKRYLYDDVRRGIAFELDGRSSASRCRALLVHLPGRAVNATYLPLSEYLRDLPKP